MKKLLTLAFLVPILSYAQIPTDGLVGYWPFNGNANDESGNGNNGIVHGAQLTIDRNEYVNSSYSFGGDGDKISINSADFNFTNEDFSVSFFIYINDESEIGKNRIIGNGSTVGFGWEIALNPSLNAIEFITNQNQSGLIRQISISNSVNYNKWYHIAVIRSGVDADIYINSVNETIISDSHINPSSSNLSLSIGAYTPAPGMGYDFNGSIDEIRIYNRVLNEEDVQALYSNIALIHQHCENIYCREGNVGVGTSTPDSKLTANGTIHTKEVKVDLDGFTAPDFVFEEDYDLASLAETEQFILANKHLAEVPSAKEMEQNGVNLKELNLKLLQKVEELTLHMIDLNKRLEKVERENGVLKELLE